MPKKYHFIGIGGVGMSPLASLLLEKGHNVSGSDMKASPVIKRLKEHGGRIAIGHDGQNVEGADFVVYSSAIKQDNPEILAARSKQIPLLQRAQLLAELMETHAGITVAGAHGKTTTTSMISQLLIKAGLDPTTAIGGIINGNSCHAALGAGRYFVAEVDESDGSFLYFKPKYSVITNIDFEHVDYYHNWDNILEAYQKFIDRTNPHGLVVACGDDARLKKLLSASPRNCMTYGFQDGNNVIARNIREIKGEEIYLEQFDCIIKDKNHGTIQLSVPGRHNILNALACVCVGLNLSIDFSVIQNSLRTYQGVKRRFQFVGQANGITVVDDYGHHPTEIKVTLETARSLKKKRVITVFQPHRYSRTKLLMDDFVKTLSLSDYLIITDIYSASEPALEGVSAKNLCDRIMKEKGSEKDIFCLKKEEIVEHLLGVTQPGDLVLTLGAGDIYRVANDFIFTLNNLQKNNVEVAGEKFS